MGTLLQVLLLEDDTALRGALRKVLSVQHEVYAVGNLAEAREALRTQKFEVAILDKGLPDGDGSDLIGEIKHRTPRCAVIMMTGDREFRSVTQCLARGADDYTLKSDNLVPELLVRIPVAVRFSELKCNAAGPNEIAPSVRLPTSVADLTHESYEHYVQATEKEFLATALRLLNGDATRTAAALGIAKSTMFKKMATLGLPRRPWIPVDMQSDSDHSLTRRDT